MMPFVGGVPFHLAYDSMDKTRVVLAEDNESVLKGIRKLLDRAQDVEVIGEAHDGLEALRMVAELSPDVLLLDVEMPLLNGVEVAHRLQNRKKKTQILVLSAYDDEEYIQAMFSNGASGYLVKDEAPRRILEAVRGVARGEKSWLSPQIEARLRGKNIDGYST